MPYRHPCDVMGHFDIIKSAFETDNFTIGGLKR